MVLAKNGFPVRFKRRIFICFSLFFVFVLLGSALVTQRASKMAYDVAAISYFPSIDNATVVAPPIEEDAPLEIATEAVLGEFEEVKQIEKAEKVSAPTLEFIAPANGEIINDFSPDELVFNATMNDWRTHMGVDYAGFIGASVFAAERGIVKTVDNSEFYGTYIEIEHEDGTLTRYLNLQENPPVSVGESVTKGQVIGGIGETGEFESALGPHLHYEINLNN